MTTIYNPKFYQIGGSLLHNHLSYIKRQADEDLYKHLNAGDFCYVLNSRQTGKSSLMVQMKKRLETEQKICGFIDLTIIGNNISQEGWYESLFYELVSQFELSINESVWWNKQTSLSPTQCLNKFVKKVLLKEVAQNIVIFIDEIDAVLSLNFSTEDFFIWIRSCYNQRADNPDYKRLTFCLIGVATPNDLTQDKNRTPFNIGKAIELSGFRLDEALPLAKGLRNYADNPKAVLKEILYWTGGQPFLTQKLCYLVVSFNTRIEVGEEKRAIEELVQSKIIENWEGQDDPQHLRTIRDRLLKDEQNTVALLELYRQLLIQGQLKTDDSLTAAKLRLSGLVIDRENNLTIYNPTYKKIFNEDFINHTLDKLHPYAQKLNKWLNSDKKDKSQLLTGKELKKARQWEKDKSLSKNDYDFLNASQQQAHKRKIVPIVVSSILIGVLIPWVVAELSRCPRGQIKIAASLGANCTKLYSSGENILFSGESNQSMEDGVKAFKDGDYSKAFDNFQEAVDSSPKNAEPQIYLNNADARQQEIKSLLIAVVIPITYKNDNAQGILRGVADAQTEFNKKQKEQNQPTLEIIIGDDINNSDISKKLANEIIRDNPNLLAVIGHYSSEATEAALPIYKLKKIPLITASATSPELESPIFLRIPSDNKMAGEKLAQYARKPGLEKVVIFYASESTFSKTMIDATFGDNYCDRPNSICFDLNEDINWEEKVKDLVNEQQVEEIVLFPSATTTSIAVSIARAKAKLPQQKPLNFVGSDTLYNFQILNQDPSAFEDIVIPVPWHSDEWTNAECKRGNSYAKRACQRWKGTVNWRTAMGYDATQAIIESINSLLDEKKDINSQNLLQKLKTICLKPEQTSGDILKFDENGNSNRQARLVQWQYDKEQKRWKFELIYKPSSPPSTCD